MPFDLIAEVVDNHLYAYELILIDTYGSRNKARKKAIAFFKDGSVTINSGEPSEYVLNTELVRKFYIAEV